MSGTNTLRVRKEAAGTPAACVRKFLKLFPEGFQDTRYLEWERSYKQAAHEEWQRRLGRAEFERKLREGLFLEVASDAVRIESRTNLLFSFEKMALRDAVRSMEGSRQFAEGLFELLHGKGTPARRFEAWCDTLANLPRRQTRVLTWPVATVFPFLAQPRRHIFLKPNVTRIAARRYGYGFDYSSRPNAKTYRALLTFAATLRQDLSSLQPRDQIDIQGFIWVQGSEEY